MEKKKMDMLKKLLENARKAELRAKSIEERIFVELEYMKIDLSLPTNADSLEEAICCFVQYGEYGLENILREIQAASEGEKK